MSSHAPVSVYLKLVGVAVIWGGTFIAGRIAAAEMAPATAALWRYVFATVTLLAASRTLEGALPSLTAKQWAGVALLGATGIAAYNLFFMYGLVHVQAGRASLIVALNPAAILLGAAVFFHERLTPRKAGGIALAIAGAAIVIAHGDVRTLLAGGVGRGDLMIFGCVVSWASFTLIAKRLMAGLSTLAMTTLASAVGTGFLAVATVAAGAPFVPPWSVAGFLALAFLGVFGTAVAFVWYNDGIRAIGAPRAAVFINLVPIAAVTLGFLMLREPLERSALAGGAIVVAGVALLNWPPRTTAAATPRG